jgi:hypothetical protein
MICETESTSPGRCIPGFCERIGHKAEHRVQNSSIDSILKKREIYPVHPDNLIFKKALIIDKQSKW